MNTEEELATNPGVEAQQEVNDAQVEDADELVDIGDDATGEDPDSPETSTEEESEEIEHEGKKYVIPKALKPALMMNADYTRKTQEVAEQRKSVEAARQQFEESQRIQQEVFAETASVYALDEQIKQFEQVDWTALTNEDPVRAQQLFFQFSQLKDRRNTLSQQITEKQQKIQLERQQSLAKQIQETNEILQRDIPNWSPEYGKKLTEYGKTHGFTAEELSQVTDARVVKLFHAAYLGSQLMEKQRKPTPETRSQIKPVTTLKSNVSTIKKHPSEMSDAEFAKYRQGVIKKRG